MRATVREIEEAAQAMIEYVDTSAYATVPWTPARHPLDLVGTVETPRELLYTAAIIGGDHTERWTGGCDADEIEGVLQVQFLLREVRGDERESTRRAADAGEHLARALTSPPWRSRRVAGPTLRTMLEAEGSTRWILCTQEILVTYYLDLTAIAQPPGVAPAFVTPPAIVGTFGEGEVLTAVPGVVTGTGPISRVYRWIWQGGPAATYGATAQVPAGATSVVLEETATGAVAPPAVAVSQSLGAGGGPVDCEVTCADTIAAAEVVATAAERSLARDWFVPGKHAALVWSDPLSLTSAHSLDVATGVMEVTTLPLVQTATPNLFAGWEGQIFGQVDLVSFFHSAFYHQIRTSLLAPTSTNGNIPHGTDLEVITLIMNGPRATATYWYGGGHAWSTSTASLSRARSSANRDGVQYVGTGDGNGNSASMLTRTQVGNSWNPNTRPISGAGSFVGGSNNLTASTSTGAPPGQSVWGTETWVAVLVGARAGTGVVGHTLRFYADILYSDADMTNASLPA